MENNFLQTLEKEELVEVVNSLLWQYRVIDAFWFINVENEFGLSRAEAINCNVWEKVGKLSARDIKQRFNIEEKGLKGFLKAMAYYSWKLMDCFQIAENGDELIATSANCPAQTGRLKHGLAEYACKEMHFREFDTFAKEIDPAIQVECVFAPPDDHPDDLFCKWRIFTAEK